MKNIGDIMLSVPRKSISVCVVTYFPDLEKLAKALQSLKNSLVKCDLDRRIFVIDNSLNFDLAQWLESTIPASQITLKSGQGNIGFARANNMVLDHIGDYHLVLNPDVEIASNALEKAVAFMEGHPECGLLTPLVHGTDGKRQFLCKRFPTLLDLALRGLASRCLLRIFKKRLDRYQMADMPEHAIYWDPPIVSGCFMLFRGNVFTALNGFDPDYFLYFEDFDLSLRTRQISRIAFVPDVRIVHSGGYASRKGTWHIWQFVKSGLNFYRKFGIKYF